MNKQRYLAELQRLLVFMTEEDRELAVRRYGEIFDAVGPEGEEDAAASLGSPTKAAIELSRGYEPGEIQKRLPPIPSAPEPEPVALTETEPDPWGDLPAFELPDTPVPGTVIEPAAEAPAAPAEPEPKPEPAPESKPAEPIQRPAAPVAEREATEKPAAVYEHSVPLGLGIPLFVLLMLALGIPLGLLCVGLTLVFLAPGAAVIFGAYLIFVGGLWCTSFVADAILLFGAALVVLALGLLILWVGLWLAVGVWKLWGRAIGWLSGELLGRKVTAYE